MKACALVYRSEEKEAEDRRRESERSNKFEQKQIKSHLFEGDRYGSNTFRKKQ